MKNKLHPALTALTILCCSVMWAQDNNPKIACTQRARKAAAAGWGIDQPVVTSKTEDGADYYAAWANRFDRQTSTCWVRVTVQTFDAKKKELKRWVYIEDVDVTQGLDAWLTNAPPFFECFVGKTKCNTEDEFYKLTNEKYGL